MIKGRKMRWFKIAVTLFLSVLMAFKVYAAAAGVDAKISAIGVVRGASVGEARDGVAVHLREVSNRYGTTNIELANNFESACRGFVVLGDPTEGFEAALLATALAAQSADGRVSVSLVKSEGDVYCTVNSLTRHTN